MTAPGSDAAPAERVEVALAGSYAIERELGRGGMATVYLAHDRKHARRVAIKVLHADLAAALGAERFLQEIRLAANLQHPHIVGLIDSGLFGPEAGELQGRPYYVMPYVDGESLRQRLEREQQLPVAEAVRLATEVAGALDYAHRQGVVHRDIKPENILLQDGSALVADFGIALAVRSAGTQRMTQTGLSLGTPQYMSPEQAMGERAITARSDIYALGAVTYEMLAGEPPFTGPTVQAVVSRLMSDEPRPLTAQRRSVPAHVAAAVLRALEKVPADRWSTAAQFATALADGATLTRASGARAPARRAASLRAAAPWLVAATLAAGLVAGAWTVARAPRAEPARSIRALLPLGDGADLRAGDVRVLPGDSLLLVAGARRRGDGLSLVRLSTGEVIPLPGTEGASAPSISPDGRSVAFRAGGQLWRTAIRDGRPTALVPVKQGGCTAWGTDDRIAVCVDEGLTVVVVPAGGGARDTLTNSRRRPQFGSVVAFPDGRFLGAARGSIWMLGGKEPLRLTQRGLVDSATADDLADAPAGTRLALLPSGHLAWVTPERELLVAPVDVSTARLTGTAVALADSVIDAAFGTNGLLVLTRGPDSRDVVLVLADRSGRRDTLPYPLAEYRTFDVSPDGRRVAAVVASGRLSELRLLDVRRPASRVLNIGGSRMAPHEPRWSPDGRRIAVRATDGDQHVLLRVDPDDARRVDTLYRGYFTPHAWSPDGMELAGSVVGAEYGALARFRPGVDSVPRPGPRVNGNEWMQSFSPDGRWYTFQSWGFRADQYGIYVAENREGASPIRIASGRYSSPAWSSDGREIVVFDSGTKTVGAIPVRPGAPPEFGEPVPLFSATGMIDAVGMDLDVLRDGRIAFREGPVRVPARALTLLTDWRVEYARRAAGARRP